MSVASAHRASLERRPVRRRGKSGLPAPVLTMTPSPWVIRKPARIVSVTSSPGRQGRIGGESERRASRPDLPSSPSRREQVAAPGPPGSRRTLRDAPAVWRAERLFAPRQPKVGKTARERSDRRRHCFAPDAPRTSLSTRLFTVARMRISRRRRRQRLRGRAVFPRRRTPGSPTRTLARWGGNRSEAAIPSARGPRATAASDTTDMSRAL